MGILRPKGCLVGIIVLVMISSLDAKKAPNRPPWLNKKLKEFRLPQPKVSHVGNKSYLVKTGKLRSWNRVKEKVSSGGPEQMAREFLTRHAKDFGMRSDLSDLQLKRAKDFHQDYRIEFIQLYKGIPVYGSDVGMIVKKDGTVMTAYSGYKLDLKLDDVNPLLSKSQAIQNSLNFLHVSGEISEGPEVKLMIFPYKKPRLVYVTSFLTDNPEGEWEVFVDAKTGEVIHLKDRLRYAYGNGQVFNPDPITSGHANYGDPGYVDNYDQDSYQLNSQRFSMDLMDIAQDSVYHLEGPYVRIVNLGGYYDPDYTSLDGNFDYTRSEQAFEAVMAYYHIDTYQRYLQSIGFFYHTDQIDIDPHGTYEDNSYFSSSEDAIYFGEGGVDDAEDADVIVHEYGHAIEKDAMGGFDYTFDESGALSEAYSDYFAGSYSASINSYQKDWVFNWDGHNEFFEGRVLNSSKHYPEDMTGDAHSDCEIWSACLWEIFNAYGREVADPIALRSLGLLWPSADFKDAAKEVLDADYWLFFGDHLNSIRNIFYNRGILTPPTVTLYFPNGGEVFVEGSTERLDWGIFDIDDLTDHIELYFSFDNGPWTLIDSNIPKYFTYYDWVIPQITSNNVRVKVVLADQAHHEIASDISDYTFSIVPKPGLTITYPVGGAVVIAGSTTNISWASSDPNHLIHHLSLHYSVDNGQTWIDIPGAGSVPDTGVYAWQVPNVLTNQAKIKIRAYNERDVLIQEDISDSTFIITTPPSVTLLWPNSPEIVVEEGNTYSVTYSGYASAGIWRVIALFSPDSGNTWTDTVGSKSYNFPNEISNDTIVWNVTEEPTLYARIKVILIDKNGLIAEDISQYDIILRPAHPTNFLAQSFSPWRSISLSWEDNSDYESGYEIERRPINGSWQVMDTTSFNVTDFIDSLINPFEEYQYQIKALNPEVNSYPCFTYAYAGPFGYDSLATAYTNGKKMLIKNNKIHIIYKNRGKIGYTSHSLWSGDWSEEEVLSGTEGYLPHMLCKGQKLVVFWEGVSGNIYINYSTDGGETWSGDYEIWSTWPPSGSGFLNSSAAFDGASDTVIYLAAVESIHPSYLDVYCAKVVDIDPGNGSWWEIEDTSLIASYSGVMNQEVTGPAISYVGGSPLIVWSVKDSLYYSGGGPPQGRSNPEFLCEGERPSLTGDFLTYQDGDDIYLRKYNSGGAPSWSDAQYIASGEWPYVAYTQSKVYVFYRGDDGLYVSYGVLGEDDWQSEELEQGNGRYINGIVINKTNRWAEDTATPDMRREVSHGDTSLQQVKRAGILAYYLYTRPLIEGGYGVRFGEKDLGPITFSGGPQSAGLVGSSFRFKGVMPNPSVGRVKMAMHLPEKSEVRLRVYDVTGRAVLRKFFKAIGPGEVEIPIRTDRLSSGVYFYQVEIQDKKYLGKFSVLR